MYAIVKTGGKQFKVAPGDQIVVEKLSEQPGETVILTDVVLVSNENGTTVGTPFVDGASVTAKVLEQGKARKIIVFKYKAKKNYHKKQGHRQPFTKLQMESIQG